MRQFESARNIAHVLLQKYNRKEVDYNTIAAEVKNIFLMQGFESLDKEALISQLEADFDIYSKEATLLVAEDVKPWLYDEKSKIKPELWNRYKIYMNQKDSSFPMDSLDDITDKILDKCVNPKTIGRWDRRGMVVGNVQSGKTANYTGLINKATDAGYKLIVVIAGIHNSLRAQTQNRIDEGFIGRDSSDFILRQKNIKIGVGHFQADTEIYSYTSSDAKGDFNRSIATRISVPIGGKSPTVLVIKKNKSILENLILWLYQFATEDEKGDKRIFNVPLLIIDDEADNASVNSGTELDVKTINRLIRTLLNLFNQNTFIGYTATPYANIFIPSSWSETLETIVKDIQLKVGEDLFPRDFIVNIPPPSNYIGAVQVFGFENIDSGEDYEGLDIIRPAEDQEPYFPKRLNKTNKDELPDDVPISLKKAIKSFILTCAIRRLRGQENKHNSMLIHVALYVAWIDRVAWLVNEIIRDYKLQIRSGQGNLIPELKELFENEFIPTTENVISNIAYKDHKIKQHNWDEVKTVLIEAVTKIEVRAVHGTKNTRLLEYHNIEDINYNDYENGMSVIAIGGNRLARGITLEGLSVSYYLRASRLYDSLMQMGRWFGYRPGYVDLCRLYTTEQLINWYRHITLATEEMRADFDEMAAKNKRPVDYRLKVRTHPGMLSITATGKMREHEKILVGFSGNTTQTYQLIKKHEVIKSNFRAFENLLEKLNDPIKNRTTNNKLNRLTWNNVQSDKIIDFLTQYTSDLPRVRPDLLNSYIRKQNKKGVLDKWTIAVILNSETKNTFSFNCNGKVIIGGLPSRSDTKKGLGSYFQISKNNILDPKDRQLDLSISDEKPNSAKAKEERAKDGKSLLVIYPLYWGENNGLPVNIPLVGWGLIFPEIENEEKVEFAARPLNIDFDYSQEDDDTETDD
ncbi:MAG: Z1 domain-containing protein [Lentimicrobium sp.]|jgi:hypothetical protein|nr:Z1 domain-containing protein [Lentimicrobium sp.]